MRATSVLGLVAGLGLLVWAVISPQPVIYLLGVLIAAVGAALLLFSWRRTRSERIEGRTPASRRARVSAGGLSAVLAVLVVAVLVGVPFLARWLPAHEGVIWQADQPHGNPVVASGGLYLAHWPDRGPDGTSLSRVSLDDGSLAWSVPGGVFLTRTGDVIARVDGTIRYYDSGGEQLWEAQAPDGENQTVGVYAARDGFVVVGSCGSAEDEWSLDCHFVGLDPTGQQAWAHDVVVDTAFTRTDDERDALGAGGSLPEALNVRQERSDQAALIDPATGNLLTRYPAESLPRQQVYGDVLVVARGTGAGCQIDGYRLTDGEQLWHVDGACSDGQVPIPEAPAYGSGQTSIAYVGMHAGGEDPETFLAIGLDDGVTQRIDRRDLAGPGASVQVQQWSVQDAVAGDLAFRWDGTTVTASGAADLEQRWQVDLPGVAVRSVTGDAQTVAIVTYASSSGHNPFSPPPPEDAPAEARPAYVSVVDAASGEIVSSTRFDDGVGRVVVPAPHQAFVQVAAGVALVGR